MNRSTDLARVVVRALIDQGIGDVVLCPGSRSAPLAYAVADAEAAGLLRLWVRTDERVAGFVALGLGRGGRPTAVITTSGTAVANLHPAVLEADHSGVPLIVLSADRPSAMRGTWANQTTPHQATMFSDAVRARLDAESSEDLGDIAEVIGAATARSRHGRPGPVHVNLALAEPLVPDSDDEIDWLTTPSRDNRAASALPLRVGARVAIERGPRTVVVAGDGAGLDAAALAADAGWPLLAEPTSGSRGPGAIGPYRLLLAEPALADQIERVVVFGRPTLSRPVTRLLNRADVEVVLVSAFAEWPMPPRAVRRVGVPVVDALGASEATEAAWLHRWMSAADAAQAALAEALDAASSLTGLEVARTIGASMHAEDLWQVSASNAVRDLDLAGGVWPVGVRVFANRGLAGIDGTLSTAIGLGLATDGPVRCLVGDLAFLHDLGGLLANPLERAPQLQIVVLNDGGGGIFSLLEYGDLAAQSGADAARFERLFGTPQHADLGALCAGFAVAHVPVKSAAELADALRPSQRVDGVSVIEVSAQRSDLRSQHAAIRDAVGLALRRAV